LVLDDLFDRNVAWALRKTRDDPGFFRRLAEQQSPRYLWIGCSDSRVPANDIVGLDPGEIFVHRNIANVVHTSDMNLLSVLEFAIEHLKVEHIIVCGHYGCGGVRRALEGATGALVDHWLAPVIDLYASYKDELDSIEDTLARVDRLCELSVELQARRLGANPIIHRAWRAGQKLKLHGWIYGLHDGMLRDLGITLASEAEFRSLGSMDDSVRRQQEPLTALRQHAIEAFSQLASLEPEEGLLCCDDHGPVRMLGV